MAIDPAALGRHVAAQIAHFPITIRTDENGPEITASFRAAKSMLNALDGGVVNLGGGALVILKSRVQNVVKAGVGRIGLKQMDSTWVEYAIASVEGYEDPNAQEITVVIEPAESE